MAGNSKAEIRARTQQAMNYFQSKGWTRAQAAGIVGNLLVESAGTLNPAIIGGYKNRAQGIAQWLSEDRKLAFQRRYGVSVPNGTFEQQLDFIEYEFRTTEKRAAAALKNTTTATQAAIVFENKYERANGQLIGRRVNAAAALNGEAAPYKGSVSTSAGSYSVSVKDPTTGKYVPNVKLTKVPNNVDIIVSDTVEELGALSSDGRIPNVLGKYTSFTPLWTLSSLSSKQVNDPESSYVRGTDKGTILLSSAGRAPFDRVRTAYTTSANPYGMYDYFMDNFEIDLLVGPTANVEGSNGLMMSFDVLEPYSVGMFMQALQIAAFENGFPDYKTAPFLLTLEFMGYNSDGEAEIVPMATRLIPLRLTGIELEITSAGSKYKVEGIAWSQGALLESSNVLIQNTVISGSTVQEMLQLGPRSLQYVINSRFQEMAKEESTTTYLPDEVAIVFPKIINQTIMPGAETVDRATVVNDSNVTKITLTRSSSILAQSKESVSELGLASMGFDMTRSGQFPKVDDNAATVDGSGGVINRASVTVDPKSREFTFSQGTTIINAITDVMLMSEYCTNSIKKGPDPSTGMYNWFKIETQVYVLNPTEGNKGNNRPPTLMVFKVLPYKVHMSRFQSPTSKSVGYGIIKQQVAKEYDYIYTGKNTEVLDFQVKLNSAMFVTQPADSGKYNGDATQNSRFGAANADNSAPTATNNNYSGSNGDSAVGNLPMAPSTALWKPSDGSGADDYATLIAKRFQSQLLGTTANEMLAIELTIQGDPYYISDSGMGNYSNSGSGPSSFVTASGAIDYQQGEVDILINFRTPVDYGNSGTLEFPETTLDIPFSGLYTVQTAKAMFNKGKFTQILSLTRRLNQDPQILDNDAKQAASTAAVENDTRATANPKTVNVAKVQERTPGTVESLIVDSPKVTYNSNSLGKGLSA